MRSRDYDILQQHILSISNIYELVTHNAIIILFISNRLGVTHAVYLITRCSVVLYYIMSCCICVCMCIYVYAYICIYGVCVYIYIYRYISLSLYVYIYVYIYIHIYTTVCMYIYIYIYIYAAPARKKALELKDQTAPRAP